MWPMIGSLISAGSSLLGGIMGQNNQQSINEQNIANQRDFAQHGIQWKVADAKAAGLNPLAALGAQTSSFQNQVGSDALPNAVSNMGQDIGRAVSAGASNEDRAYMTAQRSLALQKGELENQLLATQLRLHNQVGDPRPTVSDGSFMGGQTSSGPRVTVEPSKVEAGAPGDPTTTAGVDPDVKMLRSGDYYMPVPSRAASIAGFGSHLTPWLWDGRNVLSPMFSDDHMRLSGPAGARTDWAFDPLQGYYRTPRRGRAAYWFDRLLSE